MKHVLAAGAIASIILLLIVSCGGESDPVARAANGKIVVYPGPEGVAPSDLYAVRVTRDGKTYESFVNISRRIKHDSYSNSWTTFSFSGTINVEVEKLTGPIPQSVTIRPSRKEISASLKGRVAVFTLKAPAKISVEFDAGLLHPKDNGQPTDSMMVFADPLETNVPDPESAGVVVYRKSRVIPPNAHTLYFPPGVHFIGGYKDLIDPSTSILENDPKNPPPIYSAPYDQPPYNNRFSDLPSHIKTVYISGGAIVFGAFRINTCSDFTIRGRGILSGEKFAGVTNEGAGGPNDMGTYFFQDSGLSIGERTTHYDPRYHMVWIEHGEHIVMEGITISAASHMGVRLFGYGHHVSNIKVMGWYHNNDGITVGDDSVVQDSFFKMDDDFIKIAYGNNVVVRNNVLWQWDNGAAFQMSWNAADDIDGVYVHDNDIIHASPNSTANCAVFDAMHAGTAHLKNYTFENIYIEGPHARTLYFEIETNPWDTTPNAFGNISDVMFHNIHVGKRPENANVLKGYNAAYAIRDVLFKKFIVDGVALNPLNCTDYFDIHNASTDNIQFITGN